MCSSDLPKGTLIVTDFLNTEFHRDSVIIGDYRDWIYPPHPVYGHFGGYANVSRGQSIGSTNPRSRDGKYRRGGTWFMRKNELHLWGDSGSTFRYGYGPIYTGWYCLTNSDDLNYDSGLVPKSIDDARVGALSLGAKAFDALKPDAPDFSPVVDLLELRELPPMLKAATRGVMGKMAKHPKSSIMNRAGQYHLALQFGWLPLLGSIVNFADSFVNRTKRFDQMIRDEGRPVRRRRTLKHSGNDENEAITPWPDITLSGGFNPYVTPTHVSQCYSDSVHATVKTREWFTERVWCSGKSRYWLPPGPRTIQWRKKLMRKVLGLYCTPADVYNLIPWSWLVDYFTSVGDFFDAVSGGIADRVVFDYAYIMRSVEHHLKQEATQNVWSDSDYVASHGSTVMRSFRQFDEIQKTRIPASPFGFGLNHSDLTLRQLGILGALGLSSL